MRSLQQYQLPPDVMPEKKRRVTEQGDVEYLTGMLVLPSGAVVADTTSTRRELASRYKSGFGYEGYNGAVEFTSIGDGDPANERYGYPMDDYSEESMP